MPGFRGRHILVLNKIYVDINLLVQKPAMLTCHTCMRRCLQIIVRDLPHVSIFSERTFAPSITGTISFARNFRSPAPNEKHRIRAPIGSFCIAQKDGDNSKSNSRQEWIESRGVRPVSKRKPLLDEDRELAKQLRYLKDPLKLADYVRKTLLRDDFETAQKVVRAASKDVQCVVSWNHLVDWQLNKGSMNAAIKTYNEVFDFLFNMMTTY